MDERLAREPGAIRGMFAAVAPRYDLLNRLLSLRQDVRWRRRLVATLAEAPAGPLLDLATGTGDVALAIAGRGAGRTTSPHEPGRRVVGADFCVDMLALARRKASDRRINWVAADGLALPLEERSIAAITVAFGVRNFVDLTAGLAEMRRVLVPGGLLALLEFQRPRRAVVRLAMRVWNRAAVTPIGALISPDPAAYAYLPASVATFPDGDELAAQVRQVGFAHVRSTELSGGIVALTVARREGA